jgi:hypothetical protein
VKRLFALLAVSVGLACHGAPKEPPAKSAPDSAGPMGAHAGAALVDTALPPMPDFPDAEQGELAIHAVGGLADATHWPARAGRCRTPPMLEVLAEAPTEGLLVLLQLPDSGAVTGTYPVTFSQGGLPTAPAAQLAYERLDAKSGPATFQALDGTVELTGFDAEATGRFAVTIRNLSTDVQSQLAGSFAGLPIVELEAKMCARALAKDTTKSDTAATAKQKPPTD